MKFIKDTRIEEIVSALLSGQSKVIISGVEVFLKDLKIDTSYRKEIEANKVAEKIIVVLDS